MASPGATRISNAWSPVKPRADALRSKCRGVRQATTINDTEQMSSLVACDETQAGPSCVAVNDARKARTDLVGPEIHRRPTHAEPLSDRVDRCSVGSGEHHQPAGHQALWRLATSDQRLKTRRFRTVIEWVVLLVAVFVGIIYFVSLSRPRRVPICAGLRCAKQSDCGTHCDCVRSPSTETLFGRTDTSPPLGTCRPR